MASKRPDSDVWNIVDNDEMFWNMRKIIINCYAGQGNSLVLYR